MNKSILSPYLQGENCICVFAEFVMSANRIKTVGPKIGNPNIATIAEGPQIFGFAICGAYLGTEKIVKENFSGVGRTCVCKFEQNR